MEEIWYSGLRVVARRPVGPGDVRAIDALRGGRMRAIATTVAAPAVVLLAAPLLTGLTGLTEPLKLAVTAALSVAIALRPWRVIPACVRQMAALREDERCGEVLTCEGVGRDLIFTHGPDQRLQPAILVKGAREEPIVIEVLSRSCAILTVNGDPVRSWNQVVRSATARQSAHAHAAAHFVQLQSDDDFGVGERAMSAEELSELLAHAPPVSGLDIGLAVSLAGVTILAWWRVVAAQTPTLLLPIAATVAASIFAWRLLVRWRLNRRFAADMGLGRIVIVTRKEGAAVAEFLPISGLVWSENHTPSAWRRVPLARGTYRRRDA